MATILVKNKGGLRLKFEVSTRSKPRIRLAYPIPDFPDASTSLLSLALEVVIQTGRKGIRVISTPDVLPGGPDAVWSLFHAAYQGTAPSPLSYEEIPVQAPKVNLLIDPALPKATHKFYLQRVEGGKTYTYTEASIATPDDLLVPLSLEGILADDMITASEKAAFKAYYDAIIAEQAGYDAQADQWLVSRTVYDGAITALTTAVVALSPSYTNLSVDTSTGAAGSGATLLGLFRAVYDARTALLAAISAAQGGGVGDPFADDKLTPAEKYTVKGWYDDIINEQAGLDAAADAAAVSRSAYDTAITNLIAAMDALTGTNGWNPATHDWRNYTATYSLGAAGSGATLRGKFTSVYSARTALRNAILLAGVSPGIATETFRYKFRWDMSNGDDGGATITSASSGAPPAPDDKTARRYTATGANGPKVELLFPYSIPGNKYPIVQARIRLVSGAWDGILKYSCVSHSYSASFYQKVAAPAVGQWVILTWDMRALFIGGTEFIDGSGGDISGLKFELGTSAGTAVIDVDWAAIGSYGPGAQGDYDAARQDLLTDLYAGGNATTFANVLIFDPANLIPNPQSEIAVSTTTTGLQSGDIGAVALSNPDASNAYAGNGCRKVVGATGTTVTKTITAPRNAQPGETYYLAVRGKRQTSGTGRVRLEAYDSAGASLGTVLTLDFTSTSYAQATGMATLPANTFSFKVHLEAVSVPSGSNAYFDDFMLRRSVNSFLIVDGAIVASHFSAAAGEAGIFRVGPWYRFYSKDLTAGGTVLKFQADGGFSRPSTGEVANPDDATFYGDPTRSYPGLTGPAVRYQASFWNGTGNRSILIGLGSPYANSGLAGYELRRDPANNRFGLFSVSGIGSYTQIGSWTTLASPGTDREKITLKVYNPSSPSAGTTRLQVLFDGVLKQTWTHSDLSSPGTISGYAGIRLADTTVRAGFFAFGPGNVLLEGGDVSADHMEATSFQTSDYAEDVSGNPTDGVKMFVKTTGGSGVGLKVGPTGLQIGTAVMNQASLRVNRVHNADFADYFLARYVTTDYQMPFAWTTNPTDYSMSWSTADGSSTPYGSAIGARVTAAPSTTQTKGVAIRQVFDIPNVPPSTVFQAHLKWKLGLVKEHADITACSYRVKTYLYAPDGTSYLIDDTTISTADTGYGSGVTWTSKDYNIDTYLQAKGAGRWTLLFDSTSFGNGLSATNGSASTSRWVTGHIGRVELMT